MKKKLESDLMSIAHGVLQMKNKSDINKLYLESQKLYEKLSILKFVEDQFGKLKPTIGQEEIIEKIDAFFEEKRNHEINPEVVPVENNFEEIIKEFNPAVALAENDTEDLVVEEVIEQQKSTIDHIDFETPLAENDEIVIDTNPNKDFSFMPVFELDIDAEQNEEPVEKPQVLEISFEDYLGAGYSSTLFVKLEDEQSKSEPSLDFELPIISAPEKVAVAENISENTVVKKTALNDSFAKGIAVDLNDKIAFVNHLFGNIDEDYNRVVNQLITYDSFEEAQDFIENMVKPDYNNWEGKEAYAERFIQIIERKFATP